MNNNDVTKFKEQMAGLSHMYDKPIGKQTGEMYWNALKSLSIDEFIIAVTRHVQDVDSGKFFPKPADLLKYTVKNDKQKALAIQDSAELAWNVVVGEISRIGSWGTLKMDDGKAIAAVKAIGGWRNLCSMSNDKLNWAKKEFIAAYGCYERTPVELLPNKLPGRIAIENNKRDRQANGLGLKQVLENLNLKKDQGGDS